MPSRIDEARRLVGFVNAQIARSEKRVDAVAVQRIPRHAEFSLTAIAVGTQEVEVTWLVPIPGDYAIVASVTCAAAFVGLLTVGPKAATKTPTSCTVIVANRSALAIGAAAFDVLLFPL